MPFDKKNPTLFLLDGETLTPENLVQLSHGKLQIDLTPDAWSRIGASRALVDKLAMCGKPIYGINTGFGNFASVTIENDKLSQLQVNLITSHSAGTGRPLSPARTRMLLVLRINVLAKGFSGIRPESVRCMLNAFNKGCLSYVPEQGTVGASGDLAPLAHLALGMMGMGKMWDSSLHKWDDAAAVLKRHNLTPIQPGAKEGLAMINGTQFITSHGAEALVRASLVAKQADVVGALTLEALQGTPRAFDPKIHAARPHSGQVQCAKRLRALLHNEKNHSEIFAAHANCARVQDAYTLRCMPQVHGIAADTVEFTRGVITTEMNSATDNPMIFAETGEIISGGNFHGEYPAKALDYLTIGIHEVASVSERRVERLINPTLSGLPAFLVKEGGLNSGFMIAHCTAAALVSENKNLCNPASVDSIPTSAGKEDHVSMGGWAARKCLKVVENVEKVVAIELLAACQAIEFHRPKKTTPVLEKVYALVRKEVKSFDVDRFMAPDIDAVWKLIRSGAIWNAVAKDLGEEPVPAPVFEDLPGDHF
ncbi:histidine ammonia-lyase [Allomyces macrogynus ATCC 38327]|uniref:Histidine ammonia-lyase n=1 Tax=Allomyces macrogynus (strain ATCC 38327) TaxID=578462 RepID=A0A0L0SDX5_ALLM3|nr:histidine ammonia-lyase [Allomyces macrogynus ATCC 38327]|eukprot:KNE60686.1 histidine ammonia-lyase [Allomyces macrogynus ATCC 38327]